ncbi:extracellular solute-binding protein [Aquipuribacter hungaricus]|uniref:Extracellular solute-binding protein n=1 Tax=Aquipuribacter hungaricus TaxID=545624 RepID=A0ABV7WHL9_9MICO
MGALGVAATVVAACGGGETSGAPELTWYINNAVQVEIADACNEEAEGAYVLKTSLLPNSAAPQREQLLRRLAAGDTTVDLLSLDPPFMAEFANAGFLRPFTAEEQEELSQGVLEGPLEQSLYEDTMFSAPFYGNTQLLWYKKSVAEEAGLDPAAAPVTWDQVIEAAEQTGTTVGVQGRRNESLMVWVNALVSSAGGSILAEDSQGAAAEDVESALDSEAGAEAARIMSTIANSDIAPAGLSTAGEEESRAAFQADDGGFMVNWPYVWTAFEAAEAAGAVEEGFRDDIAWARYPQVVEGEASATPLGGIGVSIGAYTEHEEAALEAVRCVRSPERQKQNMLTAGEPAASAEVYDDPEVQEAFPMYEAIREGLTDAAPRPISPYYGDVTGVVQQGYHPPDALDEQTTPARTADFLEAVLDGSRML